MPDSAQKTSQNPPGGFWLAAYINYGKALGRKAHTIPLPQ